MMYSRADKSAVVRWWWTVDRVALACVLALIGIGLVLAFAASPAATGTAAAAGDFHYALKQVVFAGTAALILVAASLLEPRQVRVLAAVLFALALIGAALALFAGEEVNGARRWIDFGAFKLQPSEYLKPAFAVLAAAVLADKLRHGYPGALVTLGLLAPAVFVLILQPDIGQTALLVALWAAMLFFAGTSYTWIAGLGAAGGGLLMLTYMLHGHVRDRIDLFFDPNAQGYQTGLALEAFGAGGLAGAGPGAGTIKYRLPDAHTDFIFAVAGEEFGLVLCVAIAALFAAITIRLLLRAAKARELFAQLAGAGLAIAVGLQAFINMGVSLSLLPAKGMTLPFISYGGSSLFAVALTLGLALGVTRMRPLLPDEGVRR